MAVKMSSLRVVAEYDAAAYVRGMEQKVAADRAAIASAGQLEVASERSETAMASSARTIGTLSRQYVDGYGSASKFEQAVTRLARAVEQDNTTLEKAGPILDGIYRKHGMVADAVKLAEQGHLGLARVVVDLNTKLAAEREAIDRVTQATQRMQQAQQAQQQINQRLGVRDDFGGAQRGQDIAAYGAELDRLRAKFVPLVAAQQQYRAALADLSNAYRVGVFRDEREYQQALQRTKDAFAQQVQQINAAAGASRNAVNQNRAVATAAGQTTGALRLQGHQWANLSYQIQDVAVQLGSGTSPFVVALQQGPQAAMAVGGFRNAITLLGAAFNPVTIGAALVAGGIAAISARAVSAANDTREFSVALRFASREAEVTTTQLRGLVEQMRAQGVSRQEANQGILGLIRMPRLNAGQIEQISGISADVAAGSGRSVAETMRDLGSAAIEGYAGIKKLDEAFNFLTASELNQIRVMIEHGDKVGAVRMAFEKLGQQAEGLARDQMGPLSRIWTDIGRIYRGLVDAVLENPTVKSILEGVASAMGWIADSVERIGKATGVEGLTAQLAALDAQIANMRSGAELYRKSAPGMADGLDRSIATLEQRRDALRAEIDRRGREAAGGRGPVTIPGITVEGRSNNDADAKAGLVYVNEQQAAYDRLAAAYGKVGAAREVALARARAEQEAADRGITGAAREQLIRIRVGEAIRQQSAAANDNMAALNAEVASAKAVAAAWENGAAAAHDAEIAAQAHAQALGKLGVNEEALRQKMLARASAQQLAAGGKALDDLRQEVAAQERLSAASLQSTEAQAEAARQNAVAKFAHEQLGKARGDDVAKAEEQIAAYDELTRKRLADVQAAERQKATQEALTQASLAEARQRVAAQPDAALRRAGELEIARLEKVIALTRQYGEEGKRTAEQQIAFQEQLAAFDRVQAAGEWERYFGEIRQKAEGMASDVSQFLVDGFVNAGEGGKTMFDNLWNGALAGAKRLVANIVAEFLKQQFILPITTEIVSGASQLFGIVGPQQASNQFSLVPNGQGGFSISSVSSGLGLANTISGGGLFKGVGDFLGITNLFGTGSGFLGLPSLGTAFQTIGGALGIGSGVATGTMAATTAAGSAAAAEIGTAALGSAAAPGLGLSLASVALPLAAIAVPLILGGLFKSKPSNEGAEVSFQLDEGFSDFFRSTKHGDRVAQVDAYTEGLQTGLMRAASRYGVDFNTAGVVGSTFGRKEGSRFFYDPGQGIENRIWADYEAGNEESTRAAAEKVIVAAIKDGFATAEQSPDASQSARDVATAMANSIAESFADLDTDMAFAKSFQDFVAIGEGTFDPIAASYRKAVEEGQIYAAGIVEQGRAFRQQAEDLGLGTEELESGLTRADVATRGYVLSMFDQERGLASSTLEIVRQKAAIADLETSLQEFNITAEQAATITEGLTQQLKDAFLGGLQAQINDLNGLGFLNSLEAIRTEFQANSDSAWQLGLGMEKVHELSGLRIEALVREVSAGENAVANLGLLRDAFVQIGWSTQAVDNALAQLGGTMNNAVGQIMAASSNAITLAQAQATLTGMSYVPGSATELVYGAIGGSNANFNTLGQGISPVFFQTIDQLLGKARSGALTQADLTAFGQTNLANQFSYTGRWNPGELNSIASALAGLLQGQATNFPTTGSSGSSGGVSTGDSAREALQGQIDALQEQESVQRDAAREAERLAGAFGGAADSLQRYRLGLLRGSDLNPNSLADQFYEAQRQANAAWARVQAGGPDSADAARDFIDATDAMLTLGKRILPSQEYTPLFLQQMDRVQQAEVIARDSQQTQIQLQTTANAELKRIGDEIAALRSQMSSSGGTGGTPGTPGTPSTPNVPMGPSLPAPNYSFGYSGLGRLQGESADAFMRRMFPSHAGSIAGADGVVSEQEGYGWSVAPHPIGLKDRNGAPLTNAGYYAAARSGGYTGAFTSGGHLAWLAGEASGAYWRAFIDELRLRADVPQGFFDGFAGAPLKYATGGLVTGGVRGRDSVPAMLMPGEYVMPAHRVAEIGLAQMEAWRAGFPGNDNIPGAGRPILVSGVDRAMASMASTLSGISRQLDEQTRELRLANARLQQLEQVGREGNAERRDAETDARRDRAMRAPRAGQSGLKRTAGR